MEKIQFKGSIIAKVMSTFLLLVITGLSIALIVVDPSVYTIALGIWLILGLPLALATYSSFKYLFVIDQQGMTIHGLRGKKVFYFRDYAAIGQYRIRYRNGAEFSIEYIELIRPDGRPMKLSLSALGIKDAKTVVGILSQIYHPVQPQM